MKRRTFLTTAAMLAATCLLPFGTAQAKGFESDRISVVTKGEGPDVVLIPGLGSTRDVWEGTVAAVPGYRYHLVQVNGFAGHPIGGNGGTGPIVPVLAEEIARYIKEAKVRPAVIGHSMGGSLAMMIAARHPEAASKVMVVDMLPSIGMMFAPGADAAGIAAAAAKVRDGLTAASPEDRRKHVEGTIATMVKAEDQRPAAIAASLGSDQAMAARAMHDLIVTDLRPELANIKVPATVLFVRGPNIPMTDAQMEALYKMSFANLPQAKLKRIPDAWHFIMFDQPDAFAAEVKAFLAE
ncbi:alpha/beta hydrolase [Sphingosinicella sp. LY1275]|uniref:alpha/beta fold hydrolase n=1 Tax=Sphingosinicella sp. LY1275 TaxID=3095379 RepID=UPI002ADEE6B5|nr:alpha/beta hydrolase [Sphingosinicella sp. LY1275]MEA1013830.1 alpha/beta hydrolase [Sphingosinicella sp. LY1275]